MRLDVINIDPEILGGTPVFKGTRVPIESLFAHLEKGITIDEFLEDFPTVSREQVIAVLETIESLPGGTLIKDGLKDLTSGRKTVPSLLLQIGARRLRNAGFIFPSVDGNHEHELYDMLSEHDSDSAHSRYNALIRLLVSFERAVECVKK